MLVVSSVLFFQSSRKTLDNAPSTVSEKFMIREKIIINSYDNISMNIKNVYSCMLKVNPAKTYSKNKKILTPTICNLSAFSRSYHFEQFPQDYLDFLISVISEQCL